MTFLRLAVTNPNLRPTVNPFLLAFNVTMIVLALSGNSVMPTDLLAILPS